jgi:hypothetical protein
VGVGIPQEGEKEDSGPPCRHHIAQGPWPPLDQRHQGITHEEGGALMAYVLLLHEMVPDMPLEGMVLAYEPLRNSEIA